MARGFDGANSKIDTTAPLQAVDWTIAAWVYANSYGEGNNGRVARSSNSILGYTSAVAGQMNAVQALGTTNASTTSNDFSGTGAWQLVVATYTASDKKCRLYRGTLSSAVAEASYVAQTAGSGSDPGSANVTIGNFSTQTQTFDGNIARVLVTKRILTLAEMEALRLGWIPQKDSSAQGFWALDSPTATKVDDLFGLANGTATSLTVVEDPPVPSDPVGGLAVLVNVPATVDLRTGETDVVFDFSGTLSVVTPVALDGSLAVTFGASGSLSIPVALSGSFAVTFGASGSLTSGINLVSFQADRTQGINARFRFFGTLTVPVAVVAPPELSPGVSEFQNVRRVSPTMPTPTLDSMGRPSNWQPSSVVDEAWGRLQVVVNNTDVTYYLGVPCQVPNYTSNDPFDDAHAEIVFPHLSLMNASPPWLVDYANVELKLVRPNGSVKVLWEGFFASEDSKVTQTDYGLTLQCQGALYQLDLYLKKPDLAGWATRPDALVNPDGVFDIATMIADELVNTQEEHGSVWYGARVSAGLQVETTFSPPGNPGYTGIHSLWTGTWGKKLSGYIADLLAKSTTDVPGYWTQWTLMKNVPRIAYLKVRDLQTVHWTVWAGTPGVEVELSRDLTMSANAIFGTGTDLEHCRWANAKYPNLHPDTAPVWPGNLFTVGYVGQVNPNGIDTHGTTDVLLWKDRAAQLGYPVVVGDNTYTSQDDAACRQLQTNYGILVDGVVGPQTWAATFDTGANGGDPSSAYYAPLSVLNAVEPHLHTGTGANAGDNPAYQGNAPGIMRVEKFETFGNNVEKSDGIASAADEINRHWPAKWIGKATLTVDPQEGSRFEIKAGENLLVKTVGGDRLLHIAQAEHDLVNLTTSLTLDEGGRDLQTLAQVRARDRDVFDPVGRQKVTYYSQKRDSQPPQMPVFDCENGAGVIPYQGIFSRLWNVERIPFAWAGTIVRTMLSNNAAAEMAMGVFDGSGGVPTHNFLASFGEPTDSDYWMNLPDTSGLVMAWGGAGQMLGYYPKLQSTEGAPKTGAWVENASFYYECKAPPWLWVAIWCESTCYLSGQFFNQATE